MGKIDSPPESERLKKRMEIDDRRHSQEKREKLFFSGHIDDTESVIDRVAVSIAKEKSGPSRVAGEDFNQKIRWEIQRAIERYLEQNPDFKSTLYENSMLGNDIKKARETATNRLRIAYDKIISKEKAA